MSRAKYRQKKKAAANATTLKFARLRSGGTLRIANVADLDSLDPAVAASPASWALTIGASALSAMQ